MARYERCSHWVLCPGLRRQDPHIEKLDRHIATTLIDNVQVHESTKEDGIIKQCITVNYKFVGELSA